MLENLILPKLIFNMFVFSLGVVLSPFAVAVPSGLNSITANAALYDYQNNYNDIGEYVNLTNFELRYNKIPTYATIDFKDGNNIYTLSVQRITWDNKKADFSLKSNPNNLLATNPTYFSLNMVSSGKTATYYKDSRIYNVKPDLSKTIVIGKNELFSVKLAKISNRKVDVIVRKIKT